PGSRSRSGGRTRFNPPRRRWTARTTEAVLEHLVPGVVSTHLAVGGRRGPAQLRRELRVVAVSTHLAVGGRRGRRPLRRNARDAHVSTHLAVGGRRGPTSHSPSSWTAASFNPPRRRWTARTAAPSTAMTGTRVSFNPPRRRWTARTRRS